MSRVALGYEKPAVGLGTSSNSRSFEIESWSYIQHRDYNLQIMQKVEPESLRTKIPATKWDRLAYFRFNFLALYINHVVCLQFIDLNGFLWYSTLDFVCKSLPGSYVYFFLSTYAANDHLYLPKMVPISYGMNILIVCCGLLELVNASDLLFRYAYFIMQGIFSNNPWNKCNDKMSKSGDIEITCLTTSEFKQLVHKGNVSVSKLGLGVYQRRDGNNTQSYELAATKFARNIQSSVDSLHNFNNVQLLMAYMIFWILAVACHKQLTKKYIWQILSKLEWCLNLMFLVVTLHLLYAHMETGVPSISHDTSTTRSDLKLMWETDMHFFAESVSAPPVVHVLTARSAGQIYPSYDSAVMALSNFLYYMFVQMLTSSVGSYYESYVRMPVQRGKIVSFPWLFVWPLYFSTFGIGDACTMIFFILNFVLQYLVFIITYQCLLEVVVCEWRKLKWWVVTLTFTLAAFLMAAFLNSNEKIYYVASYKSIVTLLEFLVIMIYPAGRLKDDITFHYGRTPSKVRVWSIIFIPIYLLVRVYVFTSGHLTAIKTYGIPVRAYQWAWSTWCVPLTLGTFYVVYEIVIHRKKDCKALFRPLPQWGSAEHIQRQLRKKFDSREYVDSQSSRYLSRYMVGAAQAHTYRLDVCYERAGRRSTVIHDAFRMDNEKKLV